MLRKFAGLLRRTSAVVVLASLAAFAGKASALAYVGNYDPQFPVSLFPNATSWGGTVTIDVPDTGCGYSAGFTGPIYKSLSCNLTFLEATVNIYAGTPANPGPTLSTLDFPSPTAPPLSFIPTSYLYQVEFFNGKPTGINGLFSMPVLVPASQYQPNDVYYWLTFENLIPVLTWGYQSCNYLDFRCIKVGRSSNTPGAEGAADWEGPFQPAVPVPEPGTLALLLSALGVLGLVRVRKGRTAPPALA